MKVITRIIILFLFLSVGYNSTWSQVIVDTIYFDTDGIDARTYQGAPTTNYGSDTIAKVYYDYGPPNYSSWSFYKLDLSSIPDNAIVTKSSLNLYAESVVNPTAQSILVDRITSNWYEDSITYSNIPTMLTAGLGRITINKSFTDEVGWQILNITSHVQYSIANPNLNYGWRLAMAATGTADYGCTHLSSEFANSTYRPYLLVEYRIPLTDTLYFDTDGYDAFVYSGFTGTNYGTDTSLNVFWHDDTTSYASRSLIYADLSDIPRQSIITKANLFLYAEEVNNSGDHAMAVSPIIGSWSENALTWSNQPAITNSNRILFTDAASSDTGWHVMSIRAMAQSAVTSPERNYGWRINLNVESDTLDKGVVYASSESSDSLHRPFLTVEYHFPITVNAFVTHCTNGNDDGSITNIVVAGGCESYVSYGLYKLETAVLTVVEAGTNLDDADVYSLENGLYLFRVTDYTGIIGYKYFFVGEEGVSTHVEFAITHTANRANYAEDSWLTFYETTGDSSSVNASSNTFACYGGTTNSRSTLKYITDWDPTLDFSRTDQCLTYKNGCYQHTNSDNDAWVSLITEPWDERWVNWTLRPDVSMENRLYIPTTITNGIEYRNDTIDILDFVEYWQHHPEENFGFELSLANYNHVGAAYRDYGSSDYSSRNLIVSFTVRPTIETNYIDSLELGNITVNAPAAELPYTYLISYKELPIFDSIWYSVKDSIAIDSATFYRGRSNTRNYTFADLEADHYYIGVYDNNGVMILSRDVYLTPTFEVYDSTDLAVSADTLKVKSGETSAEATMFLLLPLDKSGGFEINVVQLDDEIAIGFDNVDDAFPTMDRDYVYSAEVKTSGKVYFKKSDIIVDSTTVSIDDTLKMFKSDNVMYIYKNGVEFATDTLSDTLTQDLKLITQLKGPLAQLQLIAVSIALKKPKLKYTIHHTECGQSEGKIIISIPVSEFFGALAINSYQIYDADGAFVTGGTNSAIISLVPGIYTLSYNYSVGVLSSIYATQFIIGYKVMWTNFDNTYEVPGTFNSLVTDNKFIEGTANSVNAADQDHDNFLQFSTISKHYLFGSSYEEIILENSSGDYPVRLFINEPSGSVITKFVDVYDENGFVGQFIGTSSPMRIELANDGTVKIYNNNVLVYSFPSNISGTLKVAAREFRSVVIQDAIVSFCYPSNLYVAKTKPYTDGSYFITIDDLLKFQYTGEYNQSDLLYELKDETGLVVSTSNYTIDLTSGSGILKKNADNRYTLDMQALAGGFYLLTITNVKGEKHYLRISN